MFLAFYIARALRGPIRVLRAIHGSQGARELRGLLWRRALGPLPGWAVFIVMPAAAGFLVVILSAGYSYAPLQNTVKLNPLESSRDRELREKVSKLRRERDKLITTLDRKVPSGAYIVIDQTHNRLYLKRKNEILLEATCSAGSGMILKEAADGGRKWIFDTPRGSFKVLRKIENPVWKKPDWAFVEEGLPIPKDPAERFEYGALGEYALYFGDGYMIHGTLYERLLGRSVTHGCIRLGREDLAKVYAACPLGTRIYVY